MSLNCLTCQDLQLQRTNSDRELLEQQEHQKPRRKFSILGQDRTWSGNLCPGGPASYEHQQQQPVSKSSILMGVRKTIKKDYRRVHTAAFDGHDEPRLVRSSGMRRDWSFEDLRRSRSIRNGGTDQ
ncbi:hypothetical protein Tsubulata_011768 [Turnera subulata]|uniref:Uncharacterized protein n=1 Tax=Turnera subulata TaxID=218843 RepID=A0A9Q0JNY4_9ROSI|nr:hypothetical protein Tsubulata_011768 [Turnera subulata]